MHRICVYAGSNKGVRPEYQEAAQALGKALVTRGWGLVYGGGRVGLMGVIADTVLAEGGEVIGVMPQALFPQEVAHTGVTTLYEVANMHERKATMADLSNGFVALPGGFGTYDELFEIITWAQIGIHQKPIGLLNVSGYFNPLLALIAHTTQEGFISPHHAQLIQSQASPDDLLNDLASYVPPPEKAKWTDPSIR
ncbi:TIGR00730 family Rossman fold protein [Tengunoibacter tsumagoiensis]|uniref:Cytokinin riboside 5'-monophosphate phosphoribohydrolase n=1 Tax=Tengunoibacter tsumagoiensis TaxID=2014871 RepID=A0A402A6N4_9CHLR|nr:TIGR00730 family Rossman fold protein [Tengunoibacter tsumagoiensis]GCE14794.1 cytokinin riboside 5'-monophosphate phosphoribohydrolase [Tengunoibacter tsumagoiensis]